MFKALEEKVSSVTNIDLDKMMQEHKIPPDQQKIFLKGVEAGIILAGSTSDEYKLDAIHSKLSQANDD